MSLEICRKKPIKLLDVHRTPQVWRTKAQRAIPRRGIALMLRLLSKDCLVHPLDDSTGCDSVPRGSFGLLTFYDHSWTA